MPREPADIRKDVGIVHAARVEHELDLPAVAAPRHAPVPQADKPCARGTGSPISAMTYEESRCLTNGAGRALTGLAHDLGDGDSMRFDETLPFLRAPYDFISEGCRRRGTDVFETRLMLRPTVCMRGRDAVHLFYNEARFIRKGAAPIRIQQSLLGHAGVQTLDGQEHRHRKHMFLEIMRPDRVAALLAVAERRWLSAVERWKPRREIVLYDELHELLTRAVCEWAGVPLAASEVSSRVSELTAMFDTAGAVGPRHWAARLARNRAERWCSRLIADVRAGRRSPAPDSAVAIIARHRQGDGKMIDARTAAVELLNVLRPTVAVSVFIVFAALALHVHPGARDELMRGDDAALGRFVQEVRRFYPFFPAAMARARQDFRWHGQHFHRGQRVLLDLYGTNHDGRIWNSPDAFDPSRFQDGQSPQDAFVPQGGGTYEHHHRCPGEGITVELMKQAVRWLLHEIQYEVPPQDLQIDRQRLPALPRSRFVMTNIRLAG
jgi:fatty-acid peroxygenase